jgi:hypothetical protein
MSRSTATMLLLAMISFSNGGALLEPSDGRVYHGAQTMTYEPGTDPLAGYLAALDSTTQPAVRGFFFGIPGERGPANTLSALGKFLAGADSIGFIPEISFFFIGSAATDSVIAVSSQYDWIIDSIITLSKKYGKRMFVRIGGEFNGSGPGWNGGGYHPYYYVTAFRKVTDRYAALWSRDSIATIWCYEPDAANDFDSVDSQGARWYPGDTYADWFGLDVFDAAHFDQSLPDYDRGSITKKGKSERYLGMAREKSKPVYMSEVSAKGITITGDSTDAVNDWNNWFARFWAFIEVHTEIKGFSYIDANWPAGAYPNWGDARIQNSPYITDWYNQEMTNPQYINLNSPAASVRQALHRSASDETVSPTARMTRARTGLTIRYTTGIAQKGMIGIYTPGGRILCMQEVHGNGIVFCNIPYLSHGVYCVQLKTDDAAVSGKLNY